MVPIKKADFFFPEVFRWQCSACASCWSLEQIYQIILFEAHTQCYGRLHLVHMIAKCCLVLVQRRTVRTIWGLRLHWCCNDFTKKLPKPQIKCKCNMMFFCMQFPSAETSWHLEVSTWCLNILILERKRNVSLIDDELYAKFCPTVEVHVWFVKDCTCDSSADEITIFIWDGKVAKV